MEPNVPLDTTSRAVNVKTCCQLTGLVRHFHAFAPIHPFIHLDIWFVILSNLDQFVNFTHLDWFVYLTHPDWFVNVHGSSGLVCQSGSSGPACLFDSFGPVCQFH